MTQEEFINNVRELNPRKVVKLTDREWQIIETVYTYHPSIDDKKSMAGLYLDYGMAAITDMYLRAVKISEMESQIIRQEEILERMKRRYDCYDTEDSIAAPWDDDLIDKLNQAFISLSKDYDEPPERDGIDDFIKLKIVDAIEYYSQITQNENEYGGVNE